MQRSLSPLRRILEHTPLPEGLLPEGGLAAEILDRVYVLDWTLAGRSDGLSVEVALAVQGEFIFTLPGFDLLSLVFGGPLSPRQLGSLDPAPPATEETPDDEEELLGASAPVDSYDDVAQFVDGHTLFRASLDLSDSGPRFTIQNLIFALRFDPTLLKPVALVDGEPAPDYAEIQMRGAITLDGNLNVSITGFNSISLLPAMIGETGVIISAQGVRLDLSAASPAIQFEEVSVILPDGLPLPPGLKLSMQNARIDPNGFTGELSLDLNLEYDEEDRSFMYLPSVVDGASSPATIFGFDGGLRHIGLQFQQNRLTACDLTGALVIPYFDQPAEVRLNIAPNGDVTITLSGVGDEGLALTKEELLILSVKSLSVDTNTKAITVSGGLEPLLMSSDGMQWPRLDVKDLCIDSEGKFSIKEAWLDLKELATLDLWGFHLELNRIGLGYLETDDKLWIDLSGSLRLIEQIPVGLGVEGFRLTWPRTLFDGLPTPLTLDDIQAKAADVKVEFDGVYLFFGVPDAVEFEGLIRFFKTDQVVGFAGDMALRVPAAGFAAEAGLLVGMNIEPPPLGPYPFLYVYFGVDLPAGIPLGQSGLALKGAQGMFGLNVVPAKEPEQNWYYDWYKRGPIVGAHPTNKWKPGRDALALGVGVTITTADGYVKGTRGLLVLSIPGPVLIIEGRALILNGLQPNAEPPLRALAVFDGIAGTAQFNIEAEATLIEDMLEAYGGLEAFFDFKDLTNWHLYLGQEEPRDRRIRASVLKFGDAFLFKADAYLMMDMVGAGTLRSRMGVFIGFSPRIPDIGPLEIDFDATLEGDGVVTAQPDHFSGNIGMSANIGLSVFGFGVQLAASADVLTEGPKPFKIDANVHVEVELPWPLDPVEADLEFVWQSLTVLPIESPLSGITVNSRFLPGGGGFSPAAREEKYLIHDPALTALPSQWERLAKASQPVPVDSQPIIAFHHEMNHELDSEFFARHPDGDAKYYDLGLLRFTPTLTTVKLYEHGKENLTWKGVEDVHEPDWRLIASSDTNEGKPLPGVWLTESDPQSPEAPSARRAQLWTDNPLVHTGLALGGGHSKFLGSIKEGQSLAAGVLDDYPNLMKCQHTEEKRVCIDFRGAGDVVIEPGKEWEREGLSFSAWRGARVVQSVTKIPAVSRSSVDSKEALANRNWLEALVARILQFFADVLRRFLPALSWLWDWLFGKRITRTCLFVDGYLDIRFPRSVRKVWITFCQPPKLSLSEVRSRSRVKRRAHTLTELAQVRDDALRNGTILDLRACAFDTLFNLTASSDGWLIEADEGFDCVEFIRMGEFAIAKICYLPTEEQQRAERARSQCYANAHPPGKGQTLRPGAYYRLDVTTTVLGQLNQEALPFASTSFLGDMLITAYTTVMNSLGFGDNGPPKTFDRVIFFQTEDPPGNLRPYVKWTSPLYQADRVFHKDDIAIRFLRSNVHAMFSDPYALEIQILDVKGRLAGGFKPKWLKAGSATLFAEEQVWQEYRGTLDWPPAPVTKDDLLIARRNKTAKLLPRARYEVRVLRSDKLVGPEDKDKVLFSTAFITSAFASFASLVGSYRGQSVSITAKENYQENLSEAISDLQASTRALARAEWDWYRDQVDYRFEMLKGGRRGLEEARVARRQTRATHDANFRALAESLADLYFQPFSEELEVFVLKDASTGRAVSVWIRSPESLDLRMDVLEDPEDELSNRIGYTGRTELSIDGKELTAPSPEVILHNADSTQILLFSPSTASWAAGPHSLLFKYYRDYDDETAATDHRYDRPKEFRRGKSDPEESTVEFRL